MVPYETQTEENVWQKLKAELQAQVDQHRRELQEIALMLDQSQHEVMKLAQRNASITAHLQQVQAHFDTLPREDIRTAYDSALDAQQRLFVMRGQVEKLQSDEAHLKGQVSLLERILQVIEGENLDSAGPRGRSTTAETVEMIIQAQEAERQQLARRMHDGPAQALSNFILQTEIAMRLFDVDQAKAREELDTMKASAMSTFQKVRDFVFELRPMMLDDLGLVPTLKRYVDAFKEQAGLDIRLAVTGTERRLESYQDVMIFRAIQELLNNAARHSQASQVQVHVDMGDKRVKISVEDNGKGFDLELLSDRSSMGLKVIRDRTEMLGGSFDIESITGKGTRVTFQIPAGAPRADR